MTSSPFTAVYNACVLSIPGDVLDAYGTETQHSDVFAENLFDLDPACVVATAQRQRQQLKSPPMRGDHYLEVLRRQGLNQTVKSLSAFRGVL